jgi:hypothetical protein
VNFGMDSILMQYLFMSVTEKTIFVIKYLDLATKTNKSSREYMKHVHKRVPNHQKLLTSHTFIIR